MTNVQIQTVRSIIKPCRELEVAVISKCSSLKVNMVKRSDIPALGVYVASFILCGSIIASNWHQTWDDMAITLSFARTWVESGKIALTPNSQVVEGFSTPLWFFVSAFIKWLFGLDEASMLRAIKLSSLFLLILGTIITSKALKLLLPERQKKCAYLFLPFFILHPSFLHEAVNGMENPLILVLFATSILLILQGHIRASYIPVFFLSLTRFESFLFLAPLVCMVFAKKKYTLEVVGIFIFGILIQSLWRYTAFNDFMPNTIYAKMHSHYSTGFLSMIIKRIVAIWDTLVNDCFCLIIVAVSIYKSSRPKEGLSNISSIAYAILASILTIDILIGRNDYTGNTARMYFPFLPFFLAFLLFYALQLNPSKEKSICYSYLLFSTFLAIMASSSMQRSYITVENYSKNVDFINKLQSSSIRPLRIAIPDIGGVSLFAKGSEIIDTGMLANRYLSKNGYVNFESYLFDTVHPDLFETHGRWSKAFGMYSSSSTLRILMTDFTPVSVRGKIFFANNNIVDAIIREFPGQITDTTMPGYLESALLGQSYFAETPQDVMLHSIFGKVLVLN